jgi:hypothetical protein
MMFADVGGYAVPEAAAEWFEARYTSNVWNNV